MSKGKNSKKQHILITNNYFRRLLILLIKMYLRYTVGLTSIIKDDVNKDCFNLIDEIYNVSGKNNFNNIIKKMKTADKKMSNIEEDFLYNSL
jgi:hypothetical protein